MVYIACTVTGRHGLISVQLYLHAFTYTAYYFTPITHFLFLVYMTEFDSGYF